MKSQFGNMVKDARREFKGGGIETFSERVDVIATKLSMVSISLREPTVAPKIFERLNYGAEPITVADLVRNEIFARVGNDLDAAQSLFGGSGSRSYQGSPIKILILTGFYFRMA